MDALAAPILINLFVDKDTAAKRTVMHSGDLIEALIHDFLDCQRLMEVSTQQGKSYIGFAQESGVAAPHDPDIALILLASGYRDNNTRELVITTNYADVLPSPQSADSEVSLDDFRVVVVLS